MRNYQVKVVKLTPQPTAVIRDRAKTAELSAKVPRYCGEVWQFVKSGASDVKSPGRHVAVYYGDPGNADGADIEVGVEVAAPFTGNGRVISSQLPGGEAAMVTHIGPYNELGQAYDAIIQWCKDNGREGGMRWEVYGHGGPDPSKAQTDVYCKLS